jgi:hypothetical protein
MRRKRSNLLVSRAASLRLLPLLRRPPTLDRLIQRLERLHHHLLHPKFLRLKDLDALDRFRVDLAALDVAVLEEWSVSFEVGGPNAAVL